MILLFFTLWVLFSGEITVSVCLIGAVASVLLYVFSCKVLGFSLKYELMAVRKLGRMLRYLAYLLWEMLKAGFVVMKLIYTKGRNMEPMLVHFDTALENEAARSVLANSITLTAGTITVRDEDGHFCVHALDRSLAEEIEKSPFEQKLLKLEK